MNEYSYPEEWISWVFREEMAANPYHLVPLIDIYIHILISAYELKDFFRLNFDQANGALEELSEICDMLAAE